MKFSFPELAKEARVEVAYRRRVYRRLVAESRMEQEEADRKIEIMLEMAKYFEEKSQPRLPGTE